MTRNDNRQIGRRPVLKGAGAALAGAAGLASPVAANGGSGNGGGDGGGKQPLEKTPSLVGVLVFGIDNTTSFYPDTDRARVHSFDPGFLFNTTKAEITPNGETIHYQFQFGEDSKQYILSHDGDGKYTSQGAVLNFDLDSDNELGFPAGKYRATVRDEVHLREKGGSFDWSVTRTDFFARQGMHYVGSSLIIVWDEDGPNNNTPLYRNVPIDADGDGLPDNQPEYSDDENVLGPTYDDIHATAQRLIDAGPSNPGSQ